MLTKFKNDIKALQSNPQDGFDYIPKRWALLSDKYKALIVEFENGKVNRIDVIESYKAYYAGNGSYIKPFLLTMIWGFGNAGYGNHRTNKYLDNLEHLEQIKKAFDAVKNENIALAFKELEKIKGLGMSYISKVLFFAAKAIGIKHYPLIFDIMVARSLVRFTTPAEVYQLVDIMPSSKYKDYEAYNALMHQQAELLEVEAETIELFLFNIRD